MKVKIKDIAKRAGVSDGTVSNALNNRKGISNEKRDYILKIAKDMGYFRKNSDENKLIRLLIINNQAHVIDDTPFFSELIRGIETECSSQGYDMVINYLNAKDIRTPKLQETIKSEQTSGLLLLATEMHLTDLAYFETTPIPLVVLDTAFNNTKFDYVAINNFDGTYEMVEHLIKRGHTNIGIINSSYQIHNFKERKNGYIQALTDYNIIISSKNETKVNPSLGGSYVDMKIYLQEFLSKHSKSQLPTAYYAVNDNIALGAIKAFNDMDLSISICGFDDLPISALINPALTTVHVNKRYLGKTAVSRLVEKIKNRDYDKQKVLVSTKIVERQSVKKVNT